MRFLNALALRMMTIPLYLTFEGHGRYYRRLGAEFSLVDETPYGQKSVGVYVHLVLATVGLKLVLAEAAPLDLRGFSAFAPTE